MNDVKLRIGVTYLAMCKGIWFLCVSESNKIIKKKQFFAGLYTDGKKSSKK